MWLLDVNLPTALTGLLYSYGILAETAAARGWRELTNGELAQAASRGGFRAHVRVSVTAAERIWPSASQSTRKRHRPYFAHGPLKAPPGASIVPRDRGGPIMARGEPLTSGPRGAVHSRHTTMIVARMKRFAHTIATTAHNRKVLSHARFWKFRVIGARLRRRRAGPSGGKSDEVEHV